MRPTIERIREVLNYDPETGIFRWRLPPGKRGDRVGTIAGRVDKRRGYRTLMIDRMECVAGEAAWALNYGVWPKYAIEYRNGQRDDNRIANLIASRLDAPVTAERVRDLLDYDPVAGIFHWRIPVGSGPGRKAAGDVAGSVIPAGYRLIPMDGEKLYAHRLAWLYIHGEWPADEVDHRNLNKDDNRIANLREATGSLNKANRRGRRDSAAGLKGVERKRDRWAARICKEGQRMHLGTYDTPEEAHAAYAKAARELFGEFARVA